MLPVTVILVIVISIIIEIQAELIISGFVIRGFENERPMNCEQFTEISLDLVP